MKTSLSRLLIAAGTLLAVSLPFAGLAGIQGSGHQSFALVAAVTGTGAGTVSVGGLPYSDAGATVEVDGQTGSASQIKVGDVVTAYGHDPDVIERLILNHLVRATVQSVDLAHGTFEAAGQTIHVNAQTVLVGLAGLIPGAKVQVSGWADSTGAIIASRVELLALGATQVTGQLAALDAGRQRFELNQLTVDFSSAQVEGVLEEGSEVIVTGNRFDRTGALVAQQVQLVQPLQVAAGETGRLQGIVTSFTSSTSFEINGQPVRVTSDTVLNLHGAVALNANVRVEGVFDSSGVLIASKLQTRR